MTEVYLAQWRWDTSEPTDPYWAYPIAGGLGCLDLRSLPQMSLAGGTPQGWGIFTYPTSVVIAGALALGNNLSTNLSNPQKNAIRNRLALPNPISASTLLDVLWEILTTQADSTGLLRCKPLMPTIQGSLELHLGGFSLIKSKMLNFAEPEGPNVLAVLQDDYRHIRQERLGQPQFADTHKRVLGELVRRFGGDYRRFLPVELPDEGMLKPSTTILDNFNRADNVVLGTSSEGWSWTEVTGNIDIVTNQASQLTVSAIVNARAESDLSSANHYSQAVAISNTVATNQVGIAARFAAAATTYYTFRIRLTAGRPNHRLAKMVAGALTALLDDDVIDGLTSGDTIRVDIDGSTLIGKKNGTQILQVTDTAITGNLRTGLDGFANGASRIGWDNFEAADLAAVGQPMMRRWGGIAYMRPQWRIG